MPALRWLIIAFDYCLIPLYAHSIVALRRLNVQNSVDGLIACWTNNCYAGDYLYYESFIVLLDICLMILPWWIYGLASSSFSFLAFFLNFYFLLFISYFDRFLYCCCRRGRPFKYPKPNFSEPMMLIQASEKMPALTTTLDSPAKMSLNFTAESSSDCKLSDCSSLTAALSENR